MPRGNNPSPAIYNPMARKVHPFRRMEHCLSYDAGTLRLPHEAGDLPVGHDATGRDELHDTIDFLIKEVSFHGLLVYIYILPHRRRYVLFIVISFFVCFDIQILESKITQLVLVRLLYIKEYIAF